MKLTRKKKAYTEKLKKLNKKDFAKIKDTAKSILDSYQSKINKYNETIESIKEKFKDKWAPAPLFCRVEEEDKVEKINNVTKIVIYMRQRLLPLLAYNSGPF